MTAEKSPPPLFLFKAMRNKTGFSKVLSRTIYVVQSSTSYKHNSRNIYNAALVLFSPIIEKNPNVLLGEKT